MTGDAWNCPQCMNNPCECPERNVMEKAGEKRWTTRLHDLCRIFIYDAGTYIGEAATQEQAGNIVAAFEGAERWRVMAEKGWTLWQEADNASPTRWACGDFLKNALGSGPTPEAAFDSAVAKEHE